MTSVQGRTAQQVLAAIFPGFAPLLMATDPIQEEEPTPNLPVVPVRGITNAEAWKLYERYNIEFTPPTYAELKLCEVIVALEEVVMDFTRAEQSRRTK